MIAPRTAGFAHVQATLTAMMGLVLYWLYLGLFQWTTGSLFLDNYWLYSLVAVGTLLVEGLRLAGRDPENWTRPGWNSLKLAARQTVSVGLMLSLFLVATKDKGISRLFLFSYLGLLAAGLTLSNLLLPGTLGNWLFRNRQLNTLVVGPMERVRSLRDWFERQRQYGYAFVGVLTPDRVEIGDPFTKLGGWEDLEEVVATSRARQVLMLALPPTREMSRHVVEVCERAGARLLLQTGLEEYFKHPVNFYEDGGLQFVGMREEPLESPLNRALKRAMDVAVALPVVALVLPWTTALVWVLHRSQSPGPVFFRQTRSGFQNRSFLILKYRSMHVGNPEEARQATAGDARVFRAGAWLRRTSIDELPQFWNVLMGEMSVVGPRPHLHQHNEQFAKALAEYHVRSFVKPGITGLAQVEGFRGEVRTPEDIRRRVEADIRYISSWSLWLDLAIILRTASHVLAPPKEAV